MRSRKIKLLVILLISYMMGVVIIAVIKRNMEYCNPQTSSFMITSKYLEAQTVEQYTDYLTLCNKYMAKDMQNKSQWYPNWISQDTTIKANKVTKKGYWGGKNRKFLTAEEVYEYFKLPNTSEIGNRQVKLSVITKHNKLLGEYHIYKMDVTMSEVTTYTYYITALTNINGKVTDIFVRASDKVLKSKQK